MGRENRAKKSTGKKIFQTMRFYPSQRSSLSPSSATRSTYASVCIATHAACKRAEIVTIPTERGARVRIIFIRHTESVAFGLSRRKRIGAIRRIQIGPGCAVSYLSKFSLRKTLGLGYERLNVSIWSDPHTRSEPTNEERIPP